MLYAGIAAGVVLLWVAVTYNKFISLRRKVDEAWSGISVQLKRRHDLIPNLVEVVKAYAVHESSLLEEVTKLRAAVSAMPHNTASDSLAKGEGEIGGAIGKLIFLSEAYPELKANENFIHLHEALYDAEEQLQMARRYYNGTVRRYMILYESFPSLFIAKLFSMPVREYFQLDSSAERLLPQVSLAMGPR
ncbi:MAG: Protein LemA [Desulfovibrio sp.]